MGRSIRTDGVSGSIKPKGSKGPSHEFIPKKRYGSVFVTRQRIRQPGKRGKRVFTFSKPAGSFSSDPAKFIAYSIWNATHKPPVPDIRVYDGDGRLLRVLDGLTKKEKSGS